MAKQLGPVEVCCEAPPYEVVQTCRIFGIRTPEDVRWLRLSTFRRRPSHLRRGLASYVRKLFRGAEMSSGRTCTCGKPLPQLGPILIAFDGHKETAYHFGQCPRCRTVFWESQ